MSCARLAAPSQRMQWREPRRREPHLGVAEALADLAQHRVGRQAQVVEVDITAWPPAKFESIVSSVRSISMPGCGRSARNMRGVAAIGPPSHLCAMMIAERGACRRR